MNEKQVLITTVLINVVCPINYYSSSKHQVQSVARSIDRVLYEVVDISLPVFHHKTK